MKRLLLLLALAGCGSDHGLGGTVWVTPDLLVQRIAFGEDGRYMLDTYHPDMKMEAGTWVADPAELEFTPDGAEAKRIRWRRSPDGKWLWLWWWSNGFTVYFTR